MRRTAFKNYLAFIQCNIGTLLRMVKYLEECITSLKNLVEGDDSRAEQATVELQQKQEELSKTRTKIDALKAFFVLVREKWRKEKDRVIGHVVWAPPIGVAAPPNLYTQDVCNQAR